MLCSLDVAVRELEVFSNMSPMDFVFLRHLWWAVTHLLLLWILGSNSIQWKSSSLKDNTKCSPYISQGYQGHYRDFRWTWSHWPELLRMTQSPWTSIVLVKVDLYVLRHFTALTLRSQAKKHKGNPHAFLQKILLINGIGTVSCIWDPRSMVDITTTEWPLHVAGYFGTILLN